MKKLVIITGVSGTGKSTIAKTIYENVKNSTLLSLDAIKENIYDIMGFKNKNEKKSLKPLITKIYKQLMKEALKRGDEVVIVEYPFKKKWIKFFEKIVNEYNYEIYTINVFAKNFDILWERLTKRENSKEERHPSHYLEEYDFRKKNEYIPYFEFNYNKHKKEYEQLIVNSINLGTVINIEDIEIFNVEKIIEELTN